MIFWPRVCVQAQKIATFAMSHKSGFKLLINGVLSP